MRYFLGIDIGGTAVKIGIVSEEGNIIGSVGEYPVDFDGYETPILETVIKSVKRFLSEKGEGIELSAIGVSATGGINSVEGRVDSSAGHIKNWLGSKIKERMEKEFTLPVTVLNDANAAALGEAWKGAARGCAHAVVLTIGTGVGGGIISSGKILLGKKGFAGEIGHIPLNCEGELCSCGNAGCLESLGSMSALVRRVKKGMEEGELLKTCEVNGRWIFEEAAKGNEVILSYLETWIRYIVSGIVGLVHIFDPEIVLIGGGVSTQKELFIDRVRDLVLKKVMAGFKEGLRVEAGSLGNDAGIIGAVYFAISNENPRG